MRAALLASLLRRPPALRSRSLAPRTRRLGTEAAAASSAAAGGPVALTVQGFAAFQLHTGLPWWAAIGGSAVALRVMLLPALWYQLRETRRFVALRPRFAVLRAEAASIADPSARASAYLRGVWRTARAANVQPLVVVGMPLLQIPLLILAVVASRRLVLDKDSPHAPALRTGGTAWFRDLTSPDATKLLPLAAVALVVANIQLAFHASRSPLWSMLRDVVQVGAVVGFPFYTLLPAGVFMYWVPNSLWSLAQSALVRRTAASRGLRGLTPAALASAQRMPSALPAAGAATDAAAAVVPAATVAPAPPAMRPAPLLGAELGGAPVVAPPAPPAAPAPLAPPAPAAAAAAEEEEEDAEVVALRTSIAEHEADGALRPWVEAHVQLSKRLLGAARGSDAVAHLWPAVQAAPREASGPLRFQLALALALQSNHEAAEPLLRQVLELEPSFTRASLALVSVLHAQGKTTAALELVGEIAASGAARAEPELAEWCEKQAIALRGALEAAPPR